HSHTLALSPHIFSVLPYLLITLFLFSKPPLPPSSSLFPYTTLFRSPGHWRHPQASRRQRPPPRRPPQASHRQRPHHPDCPLPPRDRKSTRLNSSHVSISYAVFCLKKKKRVCIYI